MGVTAIVKKINSVFSVKNKKKKHYDTINKLINKLQEKEEKIKRKHENENNKERRKKQLRSLAVIRAQQKKAEKLLGT